MKIKIKKLHPDAVIPQYAHGPDEDAGMDLVSVENVIVDSVTRVAVATGISIELPPGYEAQIRPRSGLALKHGITVVNAPGTIDPGYRGEIKVILTRIGVRKRAFYLSKGDRIAQLVVSKYEPITWDEVVELGDSERGEGGMGSTGR